MADIEKEKQDIPIAEGEALQQPLDEKAEDGTIAPHPPGADNVVMKDGIRVHPQPTSDPLDPLNWTTFQKHTILAIIMYK